MATKYDVFYVIAKAGAIKMNGILEMLGKEKPQYQTIFNKVIELEKEKMIQRKDKIMIVHNERSLKLFSIISFCLKNGFSYNEFLKEPFVKFLKKAAKLEFFTNGNVGIHPETFKNYTNLLSKSGLLLILSRKPLKCKLLRHPFITQLGDFFSEKINFYKESGRDYSKEIQKELSKYSRRAPPPGRRISDEIRFIYASLSLEGNPLTLPETQKLLRENLPPANESMDAIHEAENYKKAVDLMIENARKGVRLSADLIQFYHKLAMSHKDFAGRLRQENVRIKNNPSFKTSHWKEIPKRLEALLHEYDKFNREKHAISELIGFAAHFHNEFQFIHPFIDGNSRLTRLLALHILRENKIPLLDIPLGYFEMYLDLTKRSKRRDDRLLKQLFEELVLMDLKMTNSAG